MPCFQLTHFKLPRSCFRYAVLCLAGFVAALTAAPRAAHAAPISLGGDLTIDEPLVFTTPDSGIDCNGHTIRKTGNFREAIQITSHSVQVRNCVIRNFLVGITVTSRAVGPGVVIANNDIVVTEMAVRVAGATGDSESDILISENLLTTSFHEATVDIRDARFVSVVGNIVNASFTGEGVIALSSRDVSIVGNDVTNEFRDGNAVWVNQSRDVEVSRNSVSDTGTAIYVQDTQGMTVSRNAVSDARAHGIRLGGVTVRGLITVTNNSVSRCRVGISADTTDEILIASNQVADNEDSGISLGVHVGYNGQPIVIRDNVLINQEEITVGGSNREPLNLTMTNNQYR